MDTLPSEIKSSIVKLLPLGELRSYSNVAKGTNQLVEKEASHWIGCHNFLAYLARWHKLDPKRAFFLSRQWRSLDVKKSVSLTTHNSYAPKFVKRKSYAPSRFGTPHVAFGDCIAFAAYDQNGPLIAVETKGGGMVTTIPLKESCTALCYYNDHLFWGPSFQCWNVKTRGPVETKSNRSISALAGGSMLLVAVGNGLQVFPGGQEFYASGRVSCLSITGTLALVGTYEGKIEGWDLLKPCKALHVFDVGEPVGSCKLTHQVCGSILSAVVGPPTNARRLEMRFSLK